MPSGNTTANTSDIFDQTLQYKEGRDAERHFRATDRLLLRSRAESLLSKV